MPGALEGRAHAVVGVLRLGCKTFFAGQPVAKSVSTGGTTDMLDANWRSLRGSTALQYLH